MLSQIQVGGFLHIHLEALCYRTERQYRCIEYHQYEEQSKNDESQRNNADTH